MHFVFSFSISGFSNKAIPRTYQSPLVFIDFLIFPCIVWIEGINLCYVMISCIYSFDGLDVSAFSRLSLIFAGIKNIQERMGEFFSLPSKTNDSGFRCP